MGVSLLLVAPDTINNHVKTCREEQKNLHFFAPEYGGEVALSLCPILRLSFKKKVPQTDCAPSPTPFLKGQPLT